MGSKLRYRLSATDAGDSFSVAAQAVERPACLRRKPAQGKCDVWPSASSRALHPRRPNFAVRLRRGGVVKGAPRRSLQAPRGLLPPQPVDCRAAMRHRPTQRRTASARHELTAAMERCEIALAAGNFPTVPPAPRSAAAAPLAGGFETRSWPQPAHAPATPVEGRTRTDRAPSPEQLPTAWDAGR
jgi:hypothetical protein